MSGRDKKGKGEEQQEESKVDTMRGKKKRNMKSAPEEVEGKREQDKVSNRMVEGRQLGGRTKFQAKDFPLLYLSPPLRHLGTEM